MTTRISVPIGKVPLIDGTVTTPSLYFSADSDTGFYRSNANEIRMATSGSVTAAWTLTTSLFCGNNMRFSHGVTYDVFATYNAGYVDRISITITTGTVTLNGTTGGFIPQVVTTTQKNAITGIEGMIVYDSTLHKLCVYTGAGWETVTSL